MIVNFPKKILEVIFTAVQSLEVCQLESTFELNFHKTLPLMAFHAGKLGDFIKSCMFSQRVTHRWRRDGTGRWEESRRPG